MTKKNKKESVVTIYAIKRIDKKQIFFYNIKTKGGDSAVDHGAPQPQGGWHYALTAMQGEANR